MFVITFSQESFVAFLADHLFVLIIGFFILALLLFNQQMFLDCGENIFTNITVIFSKSFL
jgi:hypothetical protein